VPCRRRIPERTCATAPESHGLAWSCARCAAAIAAARRAIVTGRKPRSASAARNAAFLGGQLSPLAESFDHLRVGVIGDLPPQRGVAAVAAAHPDRDEQRIILDRLTLGAGGLLAA